MSAERERILRMLADNKLSVAEAERLLDAADRRGSNFPRPARPPLSRLALAGLLGLPAALIAGLVMFGIGLLLVDSPHDERPIIAGMIVGLAVVLTGIGLSIGGLIVTRASAPQPLRGRGLAVAGLVMPLVLVVGTVGWGAVAWHLAIGRQQMHEAQARNDAERAMREAMKEERRAVEEARKREARHRIEAQWQDRIQQLRRLSAHLSLDFGALPDLGAEYIDPDFRARLTPGMLPKPSLEPAQGELGIFSLNPVFVDLALDDSKLRLDRDAYGLAHLGEAGLEVDVAQGLEVPDPPAFLALQSETVRLRLPVVWRDGKAYLGAGRPEVEVRAPAEDDAQLDDTFRELWTDWFPRAQRELKRHIVFRTTRHEWPDGKATGGTVIDDQVPAIPEKEEVIEAYGPPVRYDRDEQQFGPPAQLAANNVWRVLHRRFVRKPDWRNRGGFPMIPAAITQPPLIKYNSFRRDDKADTRARLRVVEADLGLIIHVPVRRFWGRWFLDTGPCLAVRSAAQQVKVEQHDNRLTFFVNYMTASEDDLSDLLKAVLAEAPEADRRIELSLPRGLAVERANEITEALAALNVPVEVAEAPITLPGEATD